MSKLSSVVSIQFHMNSSPRMGFYMKISICFRIGLPVFSLYLRLRCQIASAFTGKRGGNSKFNIFSKIPNHMHVRNVRLMTVGKY